VSPGAAEVWLLDHGEIAGGGQGFGVRLAVALRDAERRVVVGCDPSGPLGEHCRDAGLEIRDMKFPSLVPWNPAIPRAVLNTRRFLRGLDPDSLVIGNHPRVHAYLYAASPRLRAPAIVAIAHEQESAGRAIARFAYRRFAALVVVGSPAAGMYRSQVPGVGVTKVNNFLPASYFERARRESAPLREPGQKSLGVLARLIPEKGVAELVEELAAPDVRPLWCEALIGGPAQEPSYADRVGRRIHELGLDRRARLLGDVEDVPGFFGSIDCLIVPSIGTEAQPTVILEALARGIPVVVRASVYSDDFEGLPVAHYLTTADLGAALRALPSTPAPVDELIRRFGPDQAVAGVEAAAQLARARS
jgi:glycosyltransferase involved in cell wall biosynthesis